MYLVVGQTGAKSWIVRVQKDGKRRDIGLGSASKVPLKLARERASQIRSQIEAGIDPVLERRKAAGIPSFKEAAKLVHAEHKRGWKNGKHQAQWLSTLEAYAFPYFGDQAISQIDTASVRDALAAIWLVKPETARRLRQRINAVVDWAVAKGYRDNGLAMPVIDKALPKQRDRVSHFQAMPYAELPKFFAYLRQRNSMSRLALEAVILTAARSGEVRLAMSRHLAKVQHCIARGKAEGARVVTGGDRPADLDRGFYIQPTVFDRVDNAMSIAREEVFGPVTAVIPYDTEAEAVAIANDSPFGLSGGVYTYDTDRAYAIARQIRTGTFTQNGREYDLTNPFGGFKQSGIGREGAQEGLEAFVEVKSVFLPEPPSHLHA